MSAILGHASPSITLSIYAHVLEEMEDRALGAVDDLLDPAEDGLGVPSAR